MRELKAGGIIVDSDNPPGSPVIVAKKDGG